MVFGIKRQNNAIHARRGGRAIVMAWVGLTRHFVAPHRPAWAGAAGESARARQTQGGGLTAPLAVSADPDDPFTLYFARRPTAGEAVQGTLSSKRGDIRWRVRIERDTQ